MDAMPRCRDCRWWQQLDIEPDYQRSDDVANDLGWGICALTKSSGEKPLHLSTKALAFHEEYDPEEDRAVLVTAPDFGCVQFDRKI